MTYNAKEDLGEERIAFERGFEEGYAVAMRLLKLDMPKMERRGVKVTPKGQRDTYTLIDDYHRCDGCLVSYVVKPVNHVCPDYLSKSQGSLI